MRLRTTPLLLLAVFLAGSASFKSAAAPDLTIQPGVAQLFVDDLLIDRELTTRAALLPGAASLRRTLRQPVKDDGGREPVIALDREFGDRAATLESNGSIVFDPRLR